MADVQLTQSVNTSLGALQRVQELIDRTQERLATGRKTQGVRGDVIADFVSRGLSNRASDLISVKNSIGQGSSQTETAVNGLDTVGRTLDQLKAVALQYQASGSPDEQAALQDQFNVLSQQLDGFARDSSFGGTNLISSTPDDLTVPFNEDGSSSLTISGEASDSATLGFAIDDIASIDAAKQQVRASAQSIGTDASVLDIRERFTTDLVNSLEEGAAKLVETDLNEEAANALTLQTRNQLAVASTGLAAQSSRAILQLF